jgi:hypothetical protein
METAMKVVSHEQFDEIVKSLDDARKLRRKLKNPNLTLAEKIALQRQAKELEAKAHTIGE